MCPFGTVGITREQEEYNAAMSRSRIAVENAFGKTANLWRTNQFTSQLQPLNMPVAALYFVSVLLTNIHTCLRQQISPFGLRPPSIEDYLNPAAFLPSAPSAALELE